MEKASSSVAIETINLSMTYRSGKLNVPALQSVNLTVQHGEFIAIMGPSGCGKSTLLHLLGGLLQPTHGNIFIDGIDISKLSDSERTAIRRDKIGYVFQRFNLLPTLTAKGNIELAKKIHGNGALEYKRSGPHPEHARAYRKDPISGLPSSPAANNSA